MRVPIRHIAGHLVWSTHGSVWAVYRLHPGPDEQGRHEETVQGTYVPAAVREEQLAKITMPSPPPRTDEAAAVTASRVGPVPFVGFVEETRSARGRFE